MANNLLNKDEQAVIDALASAWNLFCELPVEHPSDNTEMATAIHDAQKMILMRPARRALRQD